MNDQSIISFGKYAGTKLANVPASYLLWLRNQYDVDPPHSQKGLDLEEYIDENLVVIQMEAKRERAANRKEKYRDGDN